MNEITRTFDLLSRYMNKFDKQAAFVSKKNGEWIKVSSKQYIEESHYFSYGLLSKGFKKGDKIATISNNRPEWNIVDMGTAMVGVVHVPIYNTLSKDEYKYIFIFDENNDITNWYDIVEIGKKNIDEYKDKLEITKSQILPDDFATLIYTSGTTGTPKGVMLSHKNLVQNFLAVANIFRLKSHYNYLNILPLYHVGGRMGNYQTQYSGCSIYYAENMGTIAKDLKEIKAEGFDAVPRILEKIFDSIIAKGHKLSGIKKKIFFWAVNVGLKYRISGFGLGFYNIKLKIADKLVFSKWREAIGGKIKIVGCGGASLQPRLEKIFWAAGIKILNMYGLTETSPTICINHATKPNLKLGTVGPLINGVDVKIAEDGEILCKGHNVMLGYYKNPELTASVIDDEGWFHTGDIGYFKDKRFLAVTDRKKEIFKLSNGKYIAPQIIENKFKESVFIDQIMVVGENEKFASALVSPNFAYLHKWCDENEINFNNNQELIKLPRILNLFNTETKKINKSLNIYEKISRLKLVPDEWSPHSGELSSTLKLKRRIINQKYSYLLQEIYTKKSI